MTTSSHITSPTDLLFVNTYNWLVENAYAHLKGMTRENRNKYVNSVIYSRICFVLSYPLFEQQSPEIQIHLLQKATILLQSVASRKSSHVALLAADVVRKLMRDPAVPLLSKCNLFDTLYFLWWLADSSVSGVAPVNAALVQPFSDFLKETLSEPERYRAPERTHTKPRIGYLVNFTVVKAIAAGTTLFISIINGHAQAFPDHDIFIYTYDRGNVVPFFTALEGSNAAFRHFALDEDEQVLRELRDQIRADQLDYLITDAAKGVATYLYESRCAPRQIYAYMGFCCWRIRNLDLVYGFTFPWRDWMGFDPKAYLMGPVALDWSRSLRDVTPEELALARSKFPQDVKLLGFFGRFIKITEEYLRVVERILKTHPNAMFFAAGFGDMAVFDEILASPEVNGRVRVSPVPVDVSLYGRVIDVMLDSFPFAGGNILRELLFLGKPVVALHTPMMKLHYENTIDPSLVARSRDDYEALVGRLLTDDAFYQERSGVARQLGLKATDIKSENGELIRRVMAALPLEA